MKKSTVFATSALFLYAFGNVALEQKFSRYNTVSLMACFSGVTFLCALLGLLRMRIFGQKIVAPSGIVLVLALLLGLAYFFADYFYIGAYTDGGSLLTVSTIVVLFPVFASLIKYFWVGGLPNMYQVVGYLLAACAVVLVAKGGS